MFLTGNIKVANLMSLPPNKTHYDIIAQHFRYEKETIDNLFGENKFIITIMRDPIERFCSALNFLGMPRNLQGVLERLIRDKDPLFQRYDGVDYKTLSVLEKATLLFDIIEKLSEDESKMFFNSNRMFFNNIARDTGFAEDKCSPLVRVGEDEIRGFLKKTDQTIDLVLIQEYFDKSMLVLAGFLRMEQSDLYYIVENSKVSVLNSKNEANLFYTSQLSSELIAKIKKISYIDVWLYEHFKKKFELQYEVSDEALHDYKFNLLKVYATCICGRDSSGLFGTFSHYLCNEQSENESCRELITDSIAIQYITAAKQCKLRNITCPVNRVIDERIKRKNLLTQDWDSRNSIALDILNHKI